MNKIILSTIMALGLLTWGVGSYAENNQAEPQKAAQVAGDETDMVSHSEVYGKVTDVKGDTVNIKDENGNKHAIEITGFQDLQQLQVESLEKGDLVVVLFRDAEPYAVSKVAEPWTVDVDLPDFPEVDLAETTTIRGKVTEVKGDTIKFKSKDGVTHTAKITGEQNLEELEAETIEEGDIIVVSVRDGKPYGVTKHLESWLVN